jgi:hypothetical protein
MAVKPGTLENREQELTVTMDNRTIATGGKVAMTAEEQLIALRQRIAEGLAATPAAPIPECVACYRKGWLAALRSLSEE